MDIMQYFSERHDQLFYLVAGISFVVELTVLGFGGPLLFFAISCALTGVLVNLDYISGWEIELFTAGILTGITAVLIWKPLKAFQNSGGGPDTSSDMIGLRVLSSSEITVMGGSIRYSGINWNARLSASVSVSSISVDTMCIIEGVEGTVMIVKSSE